MLTGGHAKGRALPHVPGRGVRPTSARVREALFSMVGQNLHGMRVLDAFGGSGLLALEAWSRGGEVVCVERNRGAFALLKRNVDALGATVQLVRGDVLSRVEALGQFDLVLADPPYASDPQPIVDRLQSVVADTLVLEVDTATPSPSVEDLVVDRRRSYGGSDLCVYLRRGP